MVRVLFVQLPPPRFAFQEPPTNIPLAAGFLLAALEAPGAEPIDAHILESESADVFADQGLAARIREIQPSVLALTLYVWNVQRSLFLASNVKRALPETRVLVGGPEVTPDNAWVLMHPAVDAGVFGEGESRIVGGLLRLLRSEEGAAGPGTFQKDRGGLSIDTEMASPWDLSSCAYPYLDGKIGPSRDGTLFLETVRGCPFRCRYCYYHKAFQSIRLHPWNSVQRVLDFAYERDSGIREIYLMDPTFNARRGFRRLLKSMIRRRTSKDIPIHTELRADLLRNEEVPLLREAGLVSAEVGLQTINPIALRHAGRRADLEKTAEGVTMLKHAGIEVTTGIILGLPGDTPEWFARTLSWLKETEAYSVVHPFVLSVLPGADFRAKARDLGLKFDLRPPYYVRSTPTFPAEEFRKALRDCEDVFHMELDSIPPPSLVDRGPGLIAAAEESRYISKWILDPNRTRWRTLQTEVWTRASDPFTLWFRGNDAASGQAWMIEIMEGFVSANPHATLHIVWEFRVPPKQTFLRSALSASAQPGLFLNRSYRPLLSEDEVVTPRFSIIEPYRTDPAAARRMLGNYSSLANVIWDWSHTDSTGVPPPETPLLVSRPLAELGRRSDRFLDALQAVHHNDPEQVLFRDPLMQTAWNRLTRRSVPDAELPEKILFTVSD